MKKYKWATHRVVKETRDTITIYFDTRQQVVSYTSGQYINVQCAIDGEQVIRSYSLSSRPTDEFPSITVKRVADGSMSNHLVDHAASIAEWEIEGPFGSFMLDTQRIGSAPIVLLAGGSGISPLFSMIKSLDGATKVPLLIYASKSPEEAIFWHELEAIHAEGKLNTYYSFTSGNFSSSKVNHIAGRFSSLILRSIIRQRVEVVGEAHYYLCGPVGLMEVYQDALRELDIPKEQIHSEYFDPNSCGTPPLQSDGIAKDVMVNYFQDNFDSDGIQTYECTTLIEVKAEQSLLDAMKAHNIQVQSSCRNGSCGTCWAVKVDGSVHMVNNYALNEQEIEGGYILLCQSYPVDQEVVINLS